MTDGIFQGGHPSPEELAAPELADRDRQHLAVCTACRIERKIIRGGEMAGPAESTASFGESSRPSIGNGFDPEGPTGSMPPPVQARAIEASDEGLLGDGQIVGHYRLVRLIGRGGMGEVYFARDMRLGRAVALKVIRRDALSNPRARGRFEREARLTARFSHPSIVAIYDVGEFRGLPYIALEYVDGETLRDRIQRGAMEPRQALHVGLSVARALQEAHNHGVIHRDLKPENILLQRNGRVRVLDFGLARAMEVASTEGNSVSEDDSSFQTRHGEIMGSPPYMAPEQWMASPTSEATDLWAFGMVLFELLEGRRAYPTRDRTSLARQVVAPDEVPRLTHADSPIVDLVASCLAKDPAARPTAADAVEVLERQIEGGPPWQAPPNTPSTTPTPTLVPASRRTPAHLRIGIAAVAVVVVTWWAVGSMVQGQDETTTPVASQPEAAEQAPAAASSEVVPPEPRTEGSEPPTGAPRAEPGPELAMASTVAPVVRKPTAGRGSEGDATPAADPPTPSLMEDPPPEGEALATDPPSGSIAAEMWPAEWRKNGDVEVDVWLVGKDQRRFGPGEVPPGSYQILARFGAEYVEQGTLVLTANETAIVTCWTKTQNCTSLGAP